MIQSNHLMQSSNYRKKQSWAKSSLYLSELMYTMGGLKGSFQVKSAADRTMNFGTLQAKLLTKKEKNKGSCATLASQGHLRSSLTRFNSQWFGHLK